MALANKLEQAKLHSAAGLLAAGGRFDISAVLALCCIAPAERQYTFVVSRQSGPGDALGADTFHSHGEVPFKPSVWVFCAGLCSMTHSEDTVINLVLGAVERI